MADPKLDIALAAMSDLIKATIDSDRPERFSVASRTCQLAHQLARALSSRVDDFECGEEDDENGRRVMMNPIRAGRRRFAAERLMGEGDIAREAMATALPLIEQHAATQLIQAERNEADTLNSLLDAREGLSEEQTAVVNTRIEALLTKIAERNKNHAVVPAVVLRGHPTGEHREGLLVDSGAADASGAAGGEGVEEAGAAGQAVVQAVVDVRELS